MNKPSPAKKKKPGKKSTPNPTPKPVPPVPRFKLTPRNSTQSEYLQAIQANDLTFGLGPAGTGKTFLAVAAAVEAYEAHQVNKLILVRPAVEAGEKLGFLPGSLKDKVDPYLRPLYDALYEILPVRQVDLMLEDGTIEVAPIAFMRGRTLKNSFVIMDEAQNTTSTQRMMFLTRLGNNSKMVVNGDLSQCDLPKHVKSGLAQALHVLKQVEGVGFTAFIDRDVVRHRLVQKIVKAYEADDNA